MRIERGKKKTGSLNLGRTNSTHEVARVRESEFAQELNRHKEAASHYRMHELLEQVDKLCQQLQKNMNIHDLVRYKRLVKEFLQEATSHIYQIQQERGISRKGRTLLITVNTVDQELEQLVESFVKKKTDPLDMLAVMDRIRGMLLDLMV